MRLHAVLVSSVVLAATKNPSCGKITYRKEANDVTRAEWEMIVDTIKKAQQQPDDDIKNLSIWEAGAQVHLDLSADSAGKERIHGNCMFLFWHRIFLTEMEKSLQKINSKFFFPYWDTAKQWEDVEAASVWKYLGGKGNPLSNGIFGNAPFKVKGFEKPLSRTTHAWNERLYPSQFYDKLLNSSLTQKSGFAGWASDLEVSHGTFHVEVGGDQGQMSQMGSPLDPLFYLHHANIDYIWLQAQIQFKIHGLEQIGGEKGDGSKCMLSDKVPNYDVTLEQALELQNMCVDYRKPINLYKDDDDDDEVAKSVTTAARPSVPTVPAQPKPQPTQNARKPIETIRRTPESPPNQKPRTIPLPDLGARPPTNENVSRKHPKPAMTTTCTLENAAVPTKAYMEAEHGGAPAYGKGKRKGNSRSKSPNGRKGNYAHAVADQSKSMAAAKAAKEPKSKGKKGKLPPEEKLPIKEAVAASQLLMKPPANTKPKCSYGTLAKSKVDNLCPEPCPEAWIRMQGGDVEKTRATQDKIQGVCRNLINEIKSGKFLQATPQFDADERPEIVPCNSGVVKTKSISKTKKAPTSYAVGAGAPAAIKAASGIFLEKPLVMLLAFVGVFTGYEINI